MKMIDLSDSDSGKKRGWFKHLDGEFSHGCLSGDGRILQAWIRNPRHYDQHRWVLYNTDTGERIGRCSLKRERNVHLHSLGHRKGLIVERRFIPIQINAGDCIELGEPITTDCIDADLFNPNLHTDLEPVTSWCRRYEATASHTSIVERDIRTNEITFNFEADHIIGSIVYAGDTLVVSTAQTDVLIASRESGKLHKIFALYYFRRISKRHNVNLVR